MPPKWNGCSTPVRYLKGVGPYYSELLAKKSIHTVEDLLYYLPYRYLDRRNVDSIKDVSEGHDRTIVATIVTCGLAFTGKGRRKIYNMILADDTGTISAKWFRFQHRYMLGAFKKGMTLLVSGELSLYRGQKQFIHPDLQVLDTDASEDVTAPGILPLYSNIQGIGQRTIRKVIHNALVNFKDDIAETLPQNIIDQLNIPPLVESLMAIHTPEEDIDQDLLNRQATPYHRRLKFEELFYLELGLALKKKRSEQEKGINFTIPQNYAEKIKSLLPFELTGAQRRVINQIIADMTREQPMNRLIQGDVGSGKTIVALIACLLAMENGYQAVFMAPTEILAEQHFENCRKLLKDTPWNTVLLTSRLNTQEKKLCLLKIKEGTAQLVIGTHALIQEGVEYKKMGFMVVDEQHRFGVMQRAALKKKGERPDILVMTATPIPRTLAMTLYGDLDVSIIDELPPGRQPIVTRAVPERDRQEIYQTMHQILGRNEQIYIVYPLIEESEKLDLKNATDMAKHLQKDIFPDATIALLHGRMDPEKKETIMKSFKQNKTQILVSTTVIEVGIDVPNATCMVVEHAERFGLSQLHQLRGRIGRGQKASYCYLMYANRVTLEGQKRLKVMEKSQDGFILAEEDLNIRGPGDFMGTRQWGLPDLRFSHLVKDAMLLSQARELAFAHIESDPKLEKNISKYLKINMISSWIEKLEMADIS